MVLAMRVTSPVQRSNGGFRSPLGKRHTADLVEEALMQILLRTHPGIQRLQWLFTLVTQHSYSTYIRREKLNSLKRPAFQLGVPPSGVTQALLALPGDRPALLSLGAQGCSQAECRCRAKTILFQLERW